MFTRIVLGRCSPCSKRITKGWLRLTRYTYISRSAEKTSSHFYFCWIRSSLISLKF